MSDVSSPRPDSDAEPEAPVPRRRRALRWLRRLGLTLAAIVVLCVLGLVLVFFTASGTAFALRQGIAIYDAMIPGGASIGAVEGSLAGGVTIHDVRLEDRNGRPLVVAGRLELSLDPWALATASVETSTILVDELQVYLPGADTPADGGGFADLGPEGDGEPSPPSDNFGPDLPVSLSVGLQLRHATVFRTAGTDSPTPWIEVPELDAQLSAQGLHARATLQGRLAVPDEDLVVHWLRAELTWDDPGARLSTLFVQSNAATLDLDDVRVDLDREALSLASLDVTGDARWLQARTGVALDGDPRLRLSAAATTDAVSVDAGVEVPGRGELALTLDGALVPIPDLQLLVDGELAAATDVTGQPIPALFVDGAIDLFGDLATGLDATVSISCRGCLEDVGPVRLEADGQVAPDGEVASARAVLAAPGILVDLAAAMLPGRVGSAHAQVSIEQLSALHPILQRVASAPEIAGEFTTQLACVAVLEPLQGACRLEASVDEGRPVRRARLDATVAAPGPDEFVMELSALDVEARGTTVTLQRPPARVRYDPTHVSVKDLWLKLRSPTGAGSIEIGGDVDLGDVPLVDAHVRLDNVALASANAFVPDLGAGGTLDATLDAVGTAAAPELSVRATGRDLRAKGFELGSLRLTASYAEDRARADLRLAGADVGIVTFAADVPVDVDLEAGTVGGLGRGRSAVDLALRDVPLSTAAKVSDGLSTLRGRVRGELHIRRSLRRPRIALRLDVDDAALHGRALPGIRSTASYADGRAQLHVDATHPTGFDEVTLDADVPVGVDLSRGRARWRPDLEHRIDLEVEGAKLQEIHHYAPAVVARGDVDLSVHITGDMQQPRAHAELHAEGVYYEHQKVGRAAAALDYADDEATLALEASGPAVSGVGLVATVPVSVSANDPYVVWHPDRDHRVRLSVNEVLLAEALRWVPPPEDGSRPLSVAGRLDASLALDGPATAPTLRLDSHVDDVRLDHRALGEVNVEASYGSDRARADVRWTQSPHHTVSVLADVPVELDLAAGEARWRRKKPHHLRVGAPRIDRELLSPFVDTGELEATGALYVVADGTLTDFDATASLTGYIGARGRKHRVRAKLVLDEKIQTLTAEVAGRTHAAPWVRIEAQTDAPVTELVDGADWRPTKLAVTADIDDVDLEDFAALVPRDVQDLRGRLDAHAVVDGTLGAPRIAGNLDLHDGEATIVPARQQLRGIELKVTATNESIAIRRLHLKSAAGTVDGTGRFDFAPGAGMNGNLGLKIDRIPIRRPGLPRMALSGTIDTRVDADAERLGVDVTVGGARVDVFTSKIKAPRPIPTSEAVAIVDFDAPAPEPDATPPPDATATEPSGRAMRLRVTVTDPIAIVGPSIDMTWGGTIEANTNPAGETSADGALRAGRGGFALLGNEFDIERGTVTLPEDGSNVPFVDLVATTGVDDVQITAMIRGALPKPELVLSSSPAMSQSEIFTILVTGSADTGEADPAEVEAKAAGVLAALANPALQQQFNEKLRVDKVGVGFGDDTDQPILTVGKRISKKLYAETEYHHNAPKTENRAELRIEYDFAPRWSIETFFGDAAAGGVDLFWGRAFDHPKKPADDPGTPRRP